jgi:two-component system, LuxR family, response regulator FixJ
VTLHKPDNSSIADQPRIAVVEDDEHARQALIFQLQTAGFEVEAYESAEHFLKTSKANTFDCVVVDIHLPRMNGLQLQAELSHRFPSASIVFLTGNGDLALGMQAMRSGAVDFFEKPVDDEVLLNSIARGVALSRKQRAESTETAELAMRKNSLTPRESEVFALITQGLSNKQVGSELGATERTIKAHRGRVMDKMRASSLAELVRMAGILQLHDPRAQSGYRR